MLRALPTDLAESILEMVALDRADVHQIAEELSAKHKQSRGHRPADVPHVATAVRLEAGKFLTVGGSQMKLAEARGGAL